jgi:hypothetical protein
MTQVTPEFLREQIARLAATKPMREQFGTWEEFDESYNYWMSRQGQNISLLQRKLKMLLEDAVPPSP